MTSALAITPKLGCATTYTASIWYWDRSQSALRYYTTLSGVTSVNWERTLDDFSEARIRFRPIKGTDCCGKLKPIINTSGQVIEPGIWPWAHELALYRDGELVWMGPIFSIDETILPDETTDFIQITARDHLAWLDRRVVHSDIFKNDAYYDLSQIGRAIVEDAFAPDDPGVLQHLVVRPAGRLGKHSVRQWESRAGDELRTVARGGMDFTAVGRAIILGSPKRDESKSTIKLRTKDFHSGMEIRIVGAEAATCGVAVGGVPESDDPDIQQQDRPPIKTRVGGTDPFFGLIEAWSQSEGLTDEVFLEWIAAQKVAEGNPPPLTLSVPADTGLTPSAPVSIHQLVPSTYFTLLVAGTCRSLAQYMRLSHLKVTWENQSPEQVGVTFIPQNVVPLEPEEP